MIVDERIVDYIHSLETRNSDILETIEQEALKERVPIIRKEMQSFLKGLLLLKRPKRILEIGTAVAFSAILMSEYTEEDCIIDTIENYEKRIQKAKENIRCAGKEGRIHLLEGEAMEGMRKLSGPYDAIFVDAAKAQYINFLPHVLRLMKTGGVLITDNVLQEGDLIESKYVVRRRDRTIHKRLQEGGIMESRFAVERRDRTIHSRMREYLYLIKHDKRLETAVVPIGDGASVSIKKE